MKKIWILLLALVLLMGCVSCKRDPGSGDQTENQTSEVKDPGETVLQNQFTVPENLNFDQELRILHRGVYADEMNPKNSDSDSVSWSVFQRNSAVEDYLGIDIKFIESSDNTASYGDLFTKIRACASVQDEAFHLISGFAYVMPELIVENLYYDLYELNPTKTNYLNFDRLWWKQNYISAAEINASLYTIVGEAHTTATTKAEIMFLNQNLVKTYFPDINFLQLVHDGKWTYPLFLECLEQVGNGGATGGVWGLTMPYNAKSEDGWMAALGITLTQRNDFGEASVNLYTDHTLEIAKALCDLYHHNEAVSKENAFVSGRSVFCASVLEDAKGMTDKTFAFSVIPRPKWNAEQEDYYILPHDEYSCFSVISHVENTDMVSAAMETLCYQSYKLIRPVLFEETYHSRYLDDPESAELFDKIVEDVYFDFGNVFARVMDNLYHIVRYDIRDDKKDSLLTDVISKQSTAQTKLESFLNELYKLS